MDPASIMFVGDLLKSTIVNMDELKIVASFLPQKLFITKHMEPQPYNHILQAHTIIKW